MRFERGIDPGLAKTALLRACALLERSAPARAGEPIVAGTAGRRDAASRCVARDWRLPRPAFPTPTSTRILQSLGFVLGATPDGWSVAVPPRRVDVSREVDLLEEIARHYGFDRIPSTFPPLAAPPRRRTRGSRARAGYAVMTGVGFSEAVTFGFTSERAALPFADDSVVVRIKNPLSEAFAVLRPSLLPGLVESAATNVRRGQLDVRLFEMGTRFRSIQGAQQAIAFVWTGSAAACTGAEAPARWTSSTPRVWSSASAHDVGVAVETPPHPAPWLVPCRLRYGRPPTARTTARPGGELSADIAESFGLPRACRCMWRSSIGTCSPARTARAPSRPSRAFRPSCATFRCCSTNDRAVTIRTTIASGAGDILEGVREFDRYQGKGVPEGKSESVAATHVPITRANPDRCRSAAGHGQRARARCAKARRGQARVAIVSSLLDLPSVMAPSPRRNYRGSQRMVKQAVARTTDIEPIDRLEEKIRRLVAMITQLRGEQSRSADENARLAQEIDCCARGWPMPEACGVELTALRDEREIESATRVAEMLEQLESAFELSSVVTVEIAGQRYPIRSGLDERLCRGARGVRRLEDARGLRGGADERHPRAGHPGRAEHRRRIFPCARRPESALARARLNERARCGLERSSTKRLSLKYRLFQATQHRLDRPRTHAKILQLLLCS